VRGATHVRRPSAALPENFRSLDRATGRALRDAAGLETNLLLDWENLAEEVDILSRSQSREPGSSIAVVIEHRIKLETSPAVDLRPD
jgi:Domain of unknown function DUF29